MSILLVQLPVPQSNFGRRTGNIPLAAASLQHAWTQSVSLDRPKVRVMPQASATYMGDGALVAHICDAAPEIVGFTTYSWNVDRIHHLASALKERLEVKILLGGPEITPDNPHLAGVPADGLVCGEGESLRYHPRQICDGTIPPWTTTDRYTGFEHQPSPYLSGLLHPEIDDMVLLETQRGCPYHCGYCYYGKGQRRSRLLNEDHVMAAVQWTHDHEISELYLLDPSLDTRPGLREILGRVATINHDGKVALHSEIRAEAVDSSLADAMAAAGFRSLEVGLQSTNPEALRRSGRSAHLRRFMAGIEYLRERGISCSIDLIVGLPGDTLAGFMRSIDFVVTHDLCDHLQVFPLAVLPGTRFRKSHRELGLDFDPAPPYLLTDSDSFHPDDMAAALDYAESRCGLALYPGPDLDIAWRHSTDGDLHVALDGVRHICKVILTPDMTAAELAIKAKRVTHPYQLIVDHRIQDESLVTAAIRTLTAENPHTPLEVVLLSPAFEMYPERLLAAASVRRPHYLEKELAFAQDRPGCRPLLITLVSGRRDRLVGGPSCRQIYHWQAGHLPQLTEVQDAGLLDLEGVLLGTECDPNRIVEWQLAMAPHADELPAICFEKVADQRRWLDLTANGCYVKIF